VVERVILWGFMASGKSTVGAALARRLGWSCVDVDREIERHEGRTIAEIFAAEGEPAFRELEVSVSRPLLGRRSTVFACGGGWVTNRSLMDHIPPASLTVWLRVSPEAVLERVRAERGGAIRPLLGSSDPLRTARQLLAEREPIYSRADLTIATDGRDVGDLASEIEARVRASSSVPPASSPQKDHADKG